PDRLRGRQGPDPGNDCLGDPVVPLTIEIITPERMVFQEEDVESVTLPGIEGELTILPRHAALMTALQPGALRFRRGGEEFDVALYVGFLEVLIVKEHILPTYAVLAV